MHAIFCFSPSDFPTSLIPPDAYVDYTLSSCFSNYSLFSDDEDAKLLLELHTASREASHAPALPSVPHPMAFPYPFPFGYPMPFAFTPMMYPTSTSPNATNPMMAFPQGMQAPPVPVPEGVAPVPYGNLVHPNDLRRIHHQPQENGKRARVSFSPHEIRVMEEVYKVESVPSLETRLELAQKLSIPPRRIQVWFQNKRARSKKPSDRATSSGRSSTVDAESDRLSKNSTDEAHSH